MAQSRKKAADFWELPARRALIAADNQAGEQQERETRVIATAHDQSPKFDFIAPERTAGFDHVRWLYSTGNVADSAGARA